MHLSSVSDISGACWSVGISNGACYNWRKRYRGWDVLSSSDMKSNENETVRLKKIVAELELDKLILRRCLASDYL